MTWTELIDRLLAIQKAWDFPRTWVVDQVELAGYPAKKPKNQTQQRSIGQPTQCQSHHQRNQYPSQSLNTNRFQPYPEPETVANKQQKCFNANPKMNITAFDPGQKGGIAIHNQGITTAHPMPLAGKVLDLASIANLVRSHSPDIAVIEKVGSMPGQGVASTFTFGTSYGQIQGLLAGLGIPFELATPQAWKKLVLAGTPKDKDASIAYCRRAFPDVPLVMPRCRTPHDGVADALCLMQYGLRSF